MLLPYTIQWWPGNNYFNRMIDALKPSYYQSNKTEQSEMVETVLFNLKSQGQRFLTKIDGTFDTWQEVDTDAVTNKYFIQYQVVLISSISN